MALNPGNCYKLQETKGFSMKTTLISFSMLFSLSGQACVEELQKQLTAIKAADYSIEITDATEFKLKDINLHGDYLYVADHKATSNPMTSVYEAESEAMGCYGVEYVLFDKKDCRLLALGGGYCE